MPETVLILVTGTGKQLNKCCNYDYYENCIIIIIITIIIISKTILLYLLVFACHRLFVARKLRN
jgi:hypothetical protein